MHARQIGTPLLYNWVSAPHQEHFAMMIPFFTRLKEEP